MRNTLHRTRPTPSVPGRNFARRGLGALALGLAMAFAVTALGGTAAAQAPPASSDSQLDTKPVDDALERYWGEKQEVPALKRRKHKKSWRHEFSIYSGVVPNERLFSLYPIGARYNLYFHENYGVEVSGAYLIRVDSELKNFLDGNFGPAVIGDIPPTPQWNMTIDFVWTPIHGKFEAFTEKLTHFDVNIVAGLSILGTDGQELGKSVSYVEPGANIGLGMRITLLEFMAVRLDYRQHFYAAKGGATSTPAELTFGVSFWTPQSDD